MARSNRFIEEPAPIELSPEDPWRAPDVAEQIRERAKQDAAHLDADVFDDYVNTLTGLGDYNQDKMYSGSRLGADFVVQFISSYAAENRWRGSDLGARLIESIPDEMTRQGWEITVQPEEKADDKSETAGEDSPDRVDGFPPGQPPQGSKPPMPFGAGGPPPTGPVRKPEMQEIDDEGIEIAEDLADKLEELGALQAITDALCYERAYGGGCVLIGADDGSRDLAKPLNEENISEVRYLNALQGGYDGEVVAWSYYRDPANPKYGMPEIYMVRNLGVPLYRVGVPGEAASLSKQGDPYRNPALQSPANPLVFWVHESRLLVFPGPAVSRRARVQMRGWGDSLFTRVDTVLSQFGQTWAGIANMMSSYVQDVLKVEGNAIKMAMGDKASKGNPLTTRARTIQQTRSIARMTVIDATEEFDRKAATVAGVGDILDRFAQRLAGAADMPVDLLFSSMNGNALAKGDSTIRFFYDRIAARQNRKLLPQLKRLVRILMVAKDSPTKGKMPSRWNVAMRPLYQMSDAEKADVRLKVQQADTGYINAGVLSPEEVAASRFAGSEWSMETTLDLDGRKKLSDQQAEDQKAKESIMSESAKVGVPPNQLHPDHPEHPDAVPDPIDWDIPDDQEKG